MKYAVRIPAFWQATMTGRELGEKSKILARKIQRIVDSIPGEMGVSVRLVGHGSVVEVNSDEKFPLASVYKVPLMATLFHKAEQGEIDLDERLTLREEDKSLGNNDLQFFRAGLNLTLFDLCYEMIVHSDNTATDMIHYRLGLDAPEEYMASIGLDSFELGCPCREYYFLLIGWADRFKGRRLREIAETWKKMTREERNKAFAEIREQNRNSSMLEAQRRAIELWGLADEKETREDRLVSSALDNFGSPRHISMLLEQIVTNKIACPVNTSQMIDFMLLCDTRDRLPAKLPPSVLIANKTGTVPGTINDCAVIYASKKNTFCCSCLSKNVKYADMKKVEDSIANIALAAYLAFKK